MVNETLTAGIEFQCLVAAPRMQWVPSPRSFKNGLIRLPPDRLSPSRIALTIIASESVIAECTKSQIPHSTTSSRSTFAIQEPQWGQRLLLIAKIIARAENELLKYYDQLWLAVS